MREKSKRNLYTRTSPASSSIFSHINDFLPSSKHGDINPERQPPGFTVWSFQLSKTHTHTQTYMHAQGDRNNNTHVKIQHGWELLLCLPGHGGGFRWKVEGGGGKTWGMGPDRLSYPGNPSFLPWIYAGRTGCWQDKAPLWTPAEAVHQSEEYTTVCMSRRKTPSWSNACHINKRSVCMIAAISLCLFLRVNRRGLWCVIWYIPCVERNNENSVVFMTTWQEGQCFCVCLSPVVD